MNTFFITSLKHIHSFVPKHNFWQYSWSGRVAQNSHVMRQLTDTLGLTYASFPLK